MNTNQPNAFSQTVDKGYACAYSFKLYDRANGPLVLPEADDIKARVGLAGQPALVEIGTTVNANGSIVEIVTRGQVAAAPAEIRIKLGAADTALLEQSTAYQLDVILVDKTTAPPAEEDFLLTSGALTVRDTVGAVAP